MTSIAHSERAIPREALAAAGVAATLAAALAWFGPPGSDFAAHLYQSALFEDQRVRDLEQLLVRGALQLRHLQPPLLPARGAARDQAARRRQHRDGRARVRRRRRPRMGPRRTLVEPLVRRRLGGSRPLGRLPVRARHRPGAARPLGAAGRAARTLRPADCARPTASPVAFVLLAVILAGIGPLAGPAPVGAPVLPLTTLALAATVELLLLRLFPAGGRFPFSLPEFAAACVFCGLGILLTWRVATAGVLRWIYVVYLVACTAAYLVPSSLGENIARLRYAAIPIAILTLSLRRWRPLPLRRVRTHTRGRLEPDPARGQLCEEERRPGCRRCLLGSVRRSSSATTSRPPIASRPSTPSAIGPLPTSPRPASDCAWLVPPGRLPTRRAAVRRARPCALPRVAPLTRRALRRAAGCAARLQRQGGRGADRRRRLRPHRGLPVAAHHHLRGFGVAPPS